MGTQAKVRGVGGQVSDCAEHGVPGRGCGRPGLPGAGLDLAWVGVVAVTSWVREPDLPLPPLWGVFGTGGQGRDGFASFLPRVGPVAGTPSSPRAIPSNLVSLPCRVGATLLGPDCSHRTGKGALGRQGRVFWPQCPEGVLRCWVVWRSQIPALSSGCRDPAAATRLPGPVPAAV